MSELLGLVISVAFVAGVIGNIVASIIWATPPFVSLHRKLNRHHAEQMTQAARHHRDQMEAAATRHEELLAQGRKHNREQLDRLDVHVAAIQSHVTAAADAQVKAGAGTNPAEMGLPADQRVVPPAAARKRVPK